MNIIPVLIICFTSTFGAYFGIKSVAHSVTPEERFEASCTFSGGHLASNKKGMVCLDKMGVPLMAYSKK